MTLKQFLKNHSDHYFTIHKINRGFKVEYINTVIGVSVKGDLAIHSNLEGTEEGYNLTAELENINIATFEPS